MRRCPAPGWKHCPRRPNAKHKSAVNRQRFLERYRHHIKRSVEE
ncbi:DUF444 family protein, partial [Halomonas sp. 707D7]|nr:DUF444 family protein [Halomonas sp. 707D7]